MKLFKNVDVEDLASILSKGILSMEASGNYNWSDGRRADNEEDVVYLFCPVSGGCNSFPRFGCALLEVEVENPVLNEFASNDVNKNSFLEYTVPFVPADQITAVYVPSLFRDRLNLDSQILSRITFCDISADVYGDDDLRPMTQKEKELFSKSAGISCEDDLYFRGIYEDHTVMDLYNVRYDLH